MAGLGSNQAATQAVTRFGLGGRVGDAIPIDPVAWLLAQLQGPDTVPTAGLPATAPVLEVLAAEISAKTADPLRPLIDLFAWEKQTFLANALTTSAPFRERLVWFWMNHLPIMAGSIPTMATAGSYVREAIRPNVIGRYADMLQAALLHPAMLYSLNNDASVGPNSTIGLQRFKQTGLPAMVNENLARETLELFTVGIASGFTQADVDALANLLTGCNVVLRGTTPGFAYQPAYAQPGTQTLMGTAYPNTLAGLRAALLWLGTHPATFRQLATKLVRHFTSDNPPAADIASVSAALSGTGGNLAAAAAAVVQLPNAWVPLTKLRTPIDLVVAGCRALGPTHAATLDLDRALSVMGQPLWSPPFPNGWSDLAADWISPAGLLVRADWANTIAASVPGATGNGVVAAALGPLLTTATLQAVNAAPTTHDQIALLLACPEFQRR